MKKKILCLLSFFLIFSINIYADEDFESLFDEDNMFSESEMIVEKKEVDISKINIEVNQRKWSVSGEINAVSEFYEKRSYINDKDYDDFKNYISADIFTDIRLKDGMKAFGNFQIIYDADNKEDNVNYYLKELFFDNNIKNKFYYRIGKQNLKWGRAYLWNPTDFINIDKKGFLTQDKNTEGVYGIKTHIPYGVSKNIYMFLDLNNKDDIEDTALSLKYEFLIKNSEFALSTWAKDGEKARVGFDFSTRLFNIDIRGEALIYSEEKIIEIKNDEIYVSYAEKLLSDIVIGFGKSFDYGEIKDRINLNGEFYYNYGGYDAKFMDKIKKGDINIESIEKFVLSEYEPYKSGKYYFALFAEVGHLFNQSNKKMYLNFLSNISDNSHIISSGINYEPKSDFIINTGLDFYTGDKYSEIGFLGEKLVFKLEGKLRY